MLELLEEAVQARPAGFRSGAAAVVIDVATREVLALASYPIYAYDEYRANYNELRRDRRRDPLMFRAVRAQYPPGSICKAIALIGGLHEGVITPQSTITCTGHLLPDHPNMFRCWIYKQYHTTHGPQTGEDAVRNSCNIYFYKVGERLGPGRLCEWFQHFGLGRTQGTGLIEESPAIVPTEEWLMNPKRAQPRRYQRAGRVEFLNRPGRGNGHADPGRQCSRHDRVRVLGAGAAMLRRHRPGPWRAAGTE